MKKILFILISLILCIGAFFIIKNNINYKKEIAKQDLILKCEEVYQKKHKDLENTRYGEERKSDALIWSPKTKSCLAYYNIQTFPLKTFVFEVWDYSNDDLVLKYKSFESEKCRVSPDLLGSEVSLIYKFNSDLEKKGCDLTLIKEGIDVLTNFETAMEDLGFHR